MKFTLHPNVPGAQTPIGHAGSAGIDLITPVDIILPDHIDGPVQFVVDTGVIIDLEDPQLYYQILPRSSWSKLNLRLANTVGVIDYAYRGPNDTIKVVIERSSPVIHRMKKRWDLLDWMDANDYDYRGYDDNWPIAGNMHKIVKMVPEHLRQFVVYNEEKDTWHFDEIERTRLDEVPFKAGERFCQIVVMRHENTGLNYVPYDSWGHTTSRGGFGSTGK